MLLWQVCMNVSVRQRNKPALDSQSYIKWGFHEPTTHADERHKTADLWNF